MTTNHPAHGPVSLDRLHQIREILSKAAAQSDGGNLGYAMADAVKVIDVAIAVFGAEPAGYADPQSFVNFKSMGGKNAACTKEWMWRDPYNGLIPLYAAPPAPVVPEEYRHLSDLYHAQEKRLFKLAQRINGPSFDKYAHSPSQAIDVLEAAIFGDSEDACRAAMLQAGNHTEQHLDMVDHSGDANEKGDCKLPFEQWLSQQTGTIDVECGCVMTEVFFHWLRVAYEAGNSPVIPDGWIPVSDRMPYVGKKLALYGRRAKEDCAHYVDEGYLGSNGFFYFFDWEGGPRIDDCHNDDKATVTHWMYWELPAAPQQ